MILKKIFYRVVLGSKFAPKGPKLIHWTLRTFKREVQVRASEISGSNRPGLAFELGASVGASVRRGASVGASVEKNPTEAPAPGLP